MIEAESTLFYKSNHSARWFTKCHTALWPASDTFFFFASEAKLAIFSDSYSLYLKYMLVLSALDFVACHLPIMEGEDLASSSLTSSNLVLLLICC